ncbi:MAG: TonB family protein [Proteobacteria bacterium]|nr:TonB family protein [Pseudomonadota bacterium]
MRRRDTNISFKDRLAAAAVPIVIYGAIIFFTVYGFWDQVVQVESSSLPPKEDIVQATTVDAAKIEEMANMLREEEQRKEEEVRQEQERLDEIKKQAEVEEQRVEELKEQQREEERKSLELAKQREEEAEQRQKEEVERERLAEEAERQRREEAERERREVAEKVEAEQLFGSYEGAIKRAVEENFREPAGTNCSMNAVYNVNVAQNGTVQAVRLNRSSGSSEFDRAGEVAITFASPLPIPDNPRLYQHWKEFNFTFTPKGCQ